MFILVAKLHNTTFLVHETKSNQLEFFNSDPTSCLKFLAKTTGQEIDLENTKSFSTKFEFDMFFKNYLEEVVNKQELKNNFKFVEDFLKTNGTPMFAASNFIYALSDNETLELILWKNNVRSIIYTNKDDFAHIRFDIDKSENIAHVRLDLDENENTGFYSPEKEKIFSDIVERLTLPTEEQIDLVVEKLSKEVFSKLTYQEWAGSLKQTPTISIRSDENDLKRFLKQSFKETKFSIDAKLQLFKTEHYPPGGSEGRAYSSVNLQEVGNPTTMYSKTGTVLLEFCIKDYL